MRNDKCPVTSDKSKLFPPGTRTILVTGGAGFIGSHVVERLAASGARVTALDNFSTGRRENVAHLEKKLALLAADLLDRHVLKEALRGVHAVVHLAAIPSVTRSMKDPAATHRVNVEGMFALFDEARKAGVKRIVMASSSSVYGDTERLPKIESDLPRPLSPYGASKLAGEAYAQAFHRGFGLETVCLRFFNVFGPRQDPASEYAAVVPRFITALLRGHAATIYGDGRQTRDFTFVSDAVGATVAASTRGTPGAVYNIGGGSRVELLDVFELIGRVTGRPLRLNMIEPQAGDMRDTYADTDRARTDLGFAPAVTLEQGLRAQFQWMTEAGLFNP